MFSVRTLVRATLLWCVAILPAAAAEVVTVYKSPTCGCCSLWVEHLQQAGFQVETHDVARMDGVKSHLGVPPPLASCHTATVSGYVIEGHVPAREVRRLLDTRPEVAGLAVPDMPRGSPGMEFGEPEPYHVIAFSRDGSRSVFASYGE